jgi:hypothetical protein
MGDTDSKTAGLGARILGASAVYPLMVTALLLLAGSSASAQEYRGTEQQRVACTPDVFRLCAWEIPDVDRIVTCLRREKSRLSAGCRQVFDIEATTARATSGIGRRHLTHHFARHHWPREYEKSDARE